MVEAEEGLCQVLPGLGLMFRSYGHRPGLRHGFVDGAVMKVQWFLVQAIGQGSQHPNDFRDDEHTRALRRGNWCSMRRLIRCHATTFNEREREAGGAH